MTIEKLTEFAKTGQKNTDDLNLTDGFSVSKKPARQWFNWLFNTLTSKVNEIIDADFIPKADIVNNLTTDDAKKPVSAKQAKALQDNKLDKTANAVTASKLKTACNIALVGAVSGNVDFDGSGNVEIITVPNTNELRVVKGSGYTITYDDYRRIAIIELTLWTNQSITDQTISESHATNRYQIYSLPITLKKRLSVDIQLSEQGTTTSYYNEAGEWLSYAMQDGYRGYDAKTKLFVWFKRWDGSDNQPISANATIVGIF